MPGYPAADASPAHSASALATPPPGTHVFAVANARRPVSGRGTAGTLRPISTQNRWLARSQPTLWAWVATIELHSLHCAIPESVGRFDDQATQSGVAATPARVPVYTLTRPTSVPYSSRRIGNSSGP